MNAEEIAGVLRQAIEDGTWAAGEPLPTNADLIETYGASNSTVSKAVAMLKAEGLVFGRKGARPRVSDRTTLDYRLTDQTRPGWLEIERPRDMFASMLAAQSPEKELHVERMPAPPAIALRLGITTDDEVVKRQVVQSVRGRVIATETTYYPLPLALELGLDTPNDIPEGTARRVGQSQHRDTGWLTETTVRPATPEEQGLFAVVAGTPLLEVALISANGHGATSVAVRVVHPSGVRIVHEIGDDSGLDTIRKNRAAL